VKASALVDFPIGTSLGVRWLGFSGVPRSREAAFVPGVAAPVMYLGRNSDGRLPFLSQLDLHIQQAIAIDESKFYGGVDTQALIADQRLVRDPRFMMDSEFQAPRTIRLGLKFGF
jgi:hypothetical protein